jgi:hypothetical protein
MKNFMVDQEQRPTLINAVPVVEMARTRSSVISLAGAIAVVGGVFWVLVFCAIFDVSLRGLF